jgi:ABC-type phosphate transport system permease subunit
LRIVIGLIIGFMAGIYFGAYQMVEAENGLFIKVLKGIKSIVEAVVA